MQPKNLPSGNFRDRMETVRLELGMSPADLARASGLTATAISRYRSGDRMPKTEELLKIATALGVTMDWLLRGEGNRDGSRQQDPEPDEMQKAAQERAIARRAKVLELDIGTLLDKALDDISSHLSRLPDAGSERVRTKLIRDAHARIDEFHEWVLINIHESTKP